MSEISQTVEKIHFLLKFATGEKLNQLQKLLQTISKYQPPLTDSQLRTYQKIVKFTKQTEIDLQHLITDAKQVNLEDLAVEKSEEIFKKSFERIEPAPPPPQLAQAIQPQNHKFEAEIQNQIQILTTQIQHQTAQITRSSLLTQKCTLNAEFAHRGTRKTGQKRRENAQFSDPNRLDLRRFGDRFSRFEAGLPEPEGRAARRSGRNLAESARNGAAICARKRANQAAKSRDSGHRGANSAVRGPSGQPETARKRDFEELAGEKYGRSDERSFADLRRVQEPKSRPAACQPGRVRPRAHWRDFEA